jgi:ribosomal protein L37AE/L43A
VKPVVYKANPKNWNIQLPKFYKNNKTNNVSTAQKRSSPSVHISSSSSKSKNKSAVLKSGSQKKISSTKIKVPGKRSRHINNDVKLMGQEEHVCPYCLEEVVKNDSRGIVVCPECSTWHHQDCWDITGGCGVAHRNEL